MRALRLLSGILLILAVSPSPAAGRGGPGRPEDPDWTGAQTEALVALAEDYQAIVADPTKTSEKDAILARAEELGPISARAVKKVEKALFEVARSGPRVEGRGECTAHYEPFPGKYYLAGAGNRKGIFVGLHGGGPGVGDGRTAQGQWGGATGKGLIGVFPTANLEGRDTTWQSPEVMAFVIEILRELKRTYRIDTNRIYLAGHSLGGSGAWQIGLKYADLFAGVSPNAGGCHGNPVGEGKSELPGGYVANLFATPIFFTHYDQDPRVGVEDARAAAEELTALKKQHPDGYEYVYIEGKGVNHGFPRGGDPGKIISWLTRHERDPYPEKVVWEPTLPHHLFFWLRKRSFSTRGSRNSRIVATCRDNRVEIKGMMAMGLSVLLSDEMFDPDEPLIVAFNGETKYEGYPPIDPRALLESILENIDPEQVFRYRVDL